MKSVFFSALFFLSVVSAVSQDRKAATVPFYIVSVAAVKAETEAKSKARELSARGYTSGYLWIPDYASLSGAQYYCVYIGPFSTQYECEKATAAYRKIKPDAYGLLVSQEKKRVQINGIGKVSITNNEQVNGLAHVRAVFKDFIMGDIGHWIFITSNGTELDFTGNVDNSIDLDDGERGNPKFTNKSFDIFYKTEKIDIGAEGQQTIDGKVIQKLRLVK